MTRKSNQLSFKVIKSIPSDELSDTEVDEMYYMTKKCKDFENESALSFPFDEPILKSDAKYLLKDHAVSWCQSDTCVACQNPQYPVFVPSRKPRRAPPLAGSRWWEDPNGLLNALFRCTDTSELSNYIPATDGQQNAFSDTFRCW